MDLNRAQLCHLSGIVAEEIKKICEKSRGLITVKIEGLWGDQKNYDVNFRKNLHGGVDILTWYKIHPSQSNSHVVVYPHKSQAEIISQARTIEENEKYADQIKTFREYNSIIQQYLESISRGTELGTNQKDLLWIIDPLKVFQ